MLYFINISTAVAFSALMFILASLQLFLSFWITKKANAKFKREEMEKKLDKEDFEKYESDHKDVHERDRKDILYIRTKTDDIYKHLLEAKK